VNNNNHRIYSTSVASVYPLYVAKAERAERKGRSRAEVDEVILWLTGHTPSTLAAEIENNTSFEDFFAQAPKLNPPAH